MLCLLLCIVLLLVVLMWSKTSTYVPKPRLTVAYDFDDCLKSVDGRPLTRVVDSMLSHYRNGDRVIIVTARGQAGVPGIEEFLGNYGLRGRIRIYTTGDKPNREKYSTICSQNVDIFYDDQPGFLDGVAKNCPNVKLFRTDPMGPRQIIPYP